MENNQGQKRILIFSTAYLPMVGGAEIAVKEIADRLPDWHFDMITAKIRRGLSNSEKIGNINVYRVGFGFGFDKFLLPVLGLLKAGRLDKKNDYRIIWSIMASQASVAASFFKIFNPSKKLLLTLQEGDLEEHLERYVFGSKFLYDFLIKPWHLSAFKRADYLTAISHGLKQRALRNKVGVPIKIIPNGVDTEKFKKSSKEEIEGLKKQLGIRNDEKVILTASRLVKKNGLDDLIKAGQYLDFPFKILIAGSGKEKNELKALAKQLSIESRVLFLGHIDYDELPKYYSAADVFVRASRSEGFGNVFLEALACGAPVIGTAVDGSVIQILYERKAGLVLTKNPEGMPKEIADKIKVAFSGDMGEKIRNGQELIQEKYIWNIIAKQMEEVFYE